MVTVTSQPYQKTIINLWDENKDTKKGNKQQFHRVLMKCAIYKETRWTLQSILTLSSPLSLGNILEMELEQLILYTALQAIGKWNENVNEDCCVWCVSSLHLLLCSEAFAIAIWLICYFTRCIQTERQKDRDKRGNERRMVRLRL